MTELTAARLIQQHVGTAMIEDILMFIAEIIHWLRELVGILA